MPKKARPKKPASSSAAEPFFRPFERLSPAPKVKVAAAKPVAPPPPPLPRTTDAESFALHMAGVRSLDDGKTRIPRSSTPVSSLPKAAVGGPDLDEPARAALRALVTGGIRFELSDDGRALDGRRVDVDPRELRRLRKSEYPVDGTIDLHGMTTAEARVALDDFVKKRRAEGCRVVLVVHGKGLHSPRGMPILRGELGAWLSQGRAARDVAAFASVADSDGSSGSVLVLLAR